MLLLVWIICGYARMVERKMYIYTKKNEHFSLYFLCALFFFIFLSFFRRLVRFFCVFAYAGNCMWRRGVPELHPSSARYLAKVVNLVLPYRYLCIGMYLFFLFPPHIFLPLLLLFFSFFFCGFEIFITFRRCIKRNCKHSFYFRILYGMI